MTALIVMARTGLGSPLRLAAGCPLLLVSAAFSPFVLPGPWLERLSGRTAFVFPLMSLVVLLSPIVVFLTVPALAMLYAPIAALGVRGALPHLRRVPPRHALLLPFGASVLAVYLFAEVYQYPFAHVFAAEHALLGLLGPDPLFHTTIAHMIQRFGEASTGLDGLVPIHYHVGSHYWFAAVGALSGTTPRFSYPFAQMIVAIPALYLGLFSAMLCLRGVAPGAPAYIALAVGVVVLFDGIGWNSYYIGESYTAGVTTLLFSLPLLYDVVAAPRRTPWADRGRIAALLVLVLVAAVEKLSVGTILGAAVGYLALRQYGASLRTAAIVALLALTGIFCLRRVMAPTGLSLAASFSPFHLFRYRPRALSPYGPYVTFVLPVLFLLWSTWRLRPHGPTPGWPRERRREEVLTVELVLITTIVAALPGLTLRAWPGTGWWFANVAHWFVLPILLSKAALANRTEAMSGVLRGSGAVLLAALAWHSAWHLQPQRFAALARPIVTTDHGARMQSGSGTHTDGIWSYMRESLRNSGTLFGPEVRGSLERSEGARITRLVHGVEASHQQGRLIVFVPPNNSQFWRHDSWSCITRPMLIPSLTGVPMLKGLSPNCGLSAALRAYGYADYDLSSRSTAMDEMAICGHARAGGFQIVFVLNSVDRPEENRVIACGGGS
jgi:hypothetical protein